MLSWQELKHCFDVRRGLRDMFVPPPGRLEPLDGIRAFAIVWVVAFHTFLGLGVHTPAHLFAPMVQETPFFLRWLLKGDWAVDVFFVLSGFLIGHILMMEIKRTGTIDLKRFYIRRTLRIFPIYWFMVFVAGGVSLVQSNFRLDIFLINLFYIQNFFPPDMFYYEVTWSLAIEEQFYVLFPLLLLTAVFRFGRPGWWFAGLLVLATAIRAWVLELHPEIYRAEYRDIMFWSRSTYQPTFVTDLYVNLHTRFGALVAGSWAAYLTVFHAAWLKALLRRRIVSNTLLVVSLGSLFAMSSLPLFDPEAGISEGQRYAYLVFHRNVSSVFYTIFCLLVMNPTGWSHFFSRFFGARFWFPLAQLSYSIYLVHIFLLARASTIVAEWIPTADMRLQHVGLITLIGLGFCLLVCPLLFLFIERPFMNYRELREEKLRGARPASNPEQEAASG